MRRPYKILKMKSGEEIIAGVTRTKDGKYKLHRPMVFKSMVSQDFFGGMKEIFMLKNWLILSTDKQTVISQDSVNALLEPTKDVTFLYEAELKKEDKSRYRPKAYDPFTDPGLPPEVPFNTPQNSKDSIEKIQQDLEKMMEDLFKIPEEESNLKEFAKPKKDDKMVFMNMIFSPEVIVDLLRAGVLNRKELGEIINEITNGNGEGMHPNKYTGNKKDKKNLGNDWTDWNADPLSEDYR